MQVTKENSHWSFTCLIWTTSSSALILWITWCHFSCVGFSSEFLLLWACSVCVSFSLTHISIRIVAIKVFFSPRLNNGLRKRHNKAGLSIALALSLCIRVSVCVCTFHSSMFLIIMMTTWCRCERRIHGLLFVAHFYIASLCMPISSQEFLFFSFISFCFIGFWNTIIIPEAFEFTNKIILFSITSEEFQYWIAVSIHIFVSQFVLNACDFKQHAINGLNKVTHTHTSWEKKIIAELKKEMKTSNKKRS